MYRISDKSSAIKQIQNFLRIIGSNGIFIAPTGEYDENTAMAVKDYQESRGLEANGIVDYITFTQMYNEYASALSKKNLSNELKFPILPGEYSPVLTQINLILSSLMNYYGHTHWLRETNYYSKETSEAVKTLRQIYVMDDFDMIDEEFYKNIIRDHRSINIINNFDIH